MMVCSRSLLPLVHRRRFLSSFYSSWSSNDVRKQFIEFFEGKCHTHWKSSSVVPPKGSSLLFTNAGMNQFKPIFDGTVDPNTDLGKLKRACTFQKCIRAGGKHNDLDDVGMDTSHHTFFEMLGNWSFAHYSKNQAIQWSWELLTKVYKLNADRIYVTYFGGDDKLGVPPDAESRDKWLDFLPESRVLAFGSKDNFWEMGETGPCGPCTEIHYDMIGNRDSASLVNNADPTVIELKNIVFIHFYREPDGSLRPLQSKFIDTGMGLERMTSVLQNKRSNYDTDLFIPILEAIRQFSGARPYSGKVGVDDVDNVDMAYRVVADHIRAISVAIADGCLPGNEGDAYVLRRILRRAIRYGTEVLKAPQGFLKELVDVVVVVMGDVYPELKSQENRIKEVIAEEEDSFGKTLVKGIEKFKKAVQEVQGTTFSGQDTFELWDTYGFPLDLTQLMAEERGLSVDVEGFNITMEKARERSRNAKNKQSGGNMVMDADGTASLRKKGVVPTDDSFRYTWFEDKDHPSVIKAIYTGSEFLESASPGEEVGIILETTSFYAEQGGQVYDTGTLEGPDGVFEVTSVQVYGGYVVHIGEFRGNTGRLRLDEKVICKVNYDRRKQIAPNHTCTHMLNFALREVLGNHVDQKGSIVLAEKLRFDFSHGKPVKPEDLRKVELIVNEQIKAELDVFSKETKLADAKRINGIRAVFGEVYPDPVRVVAIGKMADDILANPEKNEWFKFSVELCGGTHVSNTRDAKYFAVVSEEGIAKGIRRITAVTMDEALKALELATFLEQKVNEASKARGSLLEQKVTFLNSRVEGALISSTKKADLKAKISTLQSQVIKANKRRGAENIQKAVKAATERAEVASSSGKSFCVLLVNVGSDTCAIREAVVKVMKQKGMAVMVFSIDETMNKAFVCAGVPEQDGNYGGLKVTEWLNKVLELIGGKGGGGKWGLAQGQGSETSRMDDAIEVAESFAAMNLT